MADKKIKKILVPIDGSDNSARGLDMAISIARQFKASIVGICVIYAPPRSEFRGKSSVEKGSYENVEKLMESAKTKAAQKGIVFDSKILHGDVGYTIVNFAHNKKNKIDLIIIGSRGRGAAKELFFGSVSNYVIHSSKVPVLIVR